jgi:23S rRNA (adenine-N6)-dimethyltransferase
VVSNLPFGITTDVLGRLLDDPPRGPVRADLIVQYDVARKHVATPPNALRTAAWAPWWTFDLGPRIGRDAFRPRPGVDAAVLIVRRRETPILPTRLASQFREAVRPLWEDGTITPPSRGSRRRRG